MNPLTRLVLAATVALCSLSSLNCASGEEPGGGAEQPASVTDNIPGGLTITSPARAAFVPTTENALEIKGTGATPALTINGKKVTVGADGNFTTLIIPTPGLNIIKAVDGDAKLDSPFLYGKFAKLTQAVPQAVAISFGPKGLKAPAPAATVTSIANMVLQNKDIVSGLKGQVFEGDAGPAHFIFKVASADYDSVTVDLEARREGLGIAAVAKKVVVKGALTVKFGVSITGNVSISVDRANVDGTAKLSVDEDAAIRAEMPDGDGSVEGFRYDSNNAGFPCCVDDIITNFLQPKVSDAIRDGVRKQVPDAVKLTLDGMGLPKEIDLSALGMKPVTLAAKFDKLYFNETGGFLSAAVAFGAKFEPGMPGEKAPGWLLLGQGAAAAKLADSLGVSFSLDAINQILFSTWGTGSLATKFPDVSSITEGKASAGLPPVAEATEEGGVRLSLGEVNVTGKLGGNPFTAAVSAIQEVKPSVEDGTLVLTPVGETTLSITWLDAEQVNEGLRKIIVGLAQGMIKDYLKPIRLPLPTIAVDALGPAFKGKAISVKGAQILVDHPGARLGISGALELK